MEFSKLLDKRRSCRSYTGAPITKKQLDYIMYAAVHAPSACNKQSWHFTVICDREVIKKFSSRIHGKQLDSKLRRCHYCFNRQRRH